MFDVRCSTFFNAEHPASEQQTCIRIIETAMTEHGNIFDPSPRAKDYRERLTAFMQEQVYPNEATYHAQGQTGDRWRPRPIVEELKGRAKAAGLWNLFLPESAL